MRTDQHSPKNFDPAAYSYVGTLYQGPNDEINDALNDELDWEQLQHKAAATGGNWCQKSTCDHCGAAFHYGAVFEHSSGEWVVVGHICADEAFGHEDRRSYDLQRMRQRVTAMRARIKARKAAAAFLEAHPGLVEALEVEHHITADIRRRFFQYGELSDKQVELAHKLQKQVAEREARLASVPALEEGRRELTGRILSTKYQETMYGDTFKMLVELEDGNRVWGTVPAILKSYMEKLEKAAHMRGESFSWPDTYKTLTIEFTATVERSKDDEHFGFFKRPTKLRAK